MGSSAGTLAVAFGDSKSIFRHPLHSASIKSLGKMERPRLAGAIEAKTADLQRQNGALDTGRCLAKSVLA
jgi:hypothetical protein